MMNAFGEGGRLGLVDGLLEPLDVPAENASCRTSTPPAPGIRQAGAHREKVRWIPVTRCAVRRRQNAPDQPQAGFNSSISP